MGSFGILIGFIDPVFQLCLVKGYVSLAFTIYDNLKETNDSASL